MTAFAPIPEAEARRRFAEQADKLLTRSHAKWFAPVSLPVDVTDEEQFPQIARVLREMAPEQKAWADADWENG